MEVLEKQNAFVEIEALIKIDPKTNHIWAINMDAQANMKPVFIPPEDRHDAKEGDKVAVRVKQPSQAGTEIVSQMSLFVAF